MKKNGFTLLELVVVLGIVAILTGITLLNSNLLLFKKEKKELQQLIDLIEFAKDKAIIAGYNCTIYFDFDQNKVYYVENLTRKEAIKFQHIKISRINYGKVVFKSNGVPERGMSIRIKFSKKQFKLTISPVTSKVRLYRE